jgi:hypothetical protein
VEHLLGWRPPLALGGGGERLPARAGKCPPASWSHLKRGIGNLAVHGVDQLLTITRHRLKRIQYRPDLIDGFLAHIGLSLGPDSTQPFKICSTIPNASSSRGTASAGCWCRSSSAGRRAGSWAT